ncbi:hypothetical protein [Candidatus Entotheonella palauensis]|uniref:hypothetical protein n=1 Tax=Candidatus Entotheonella palauensis TaxID=93172 RepID=UPI000B7F1982|nr:hypothetical protein [Candidatus Entotheonella palauensis]
MREHLIFIHDVLLPYANILENRKQNPKKLGNCGDLAAVTFKRLLARPKLRINYATSRGAGGTHCLMLVTLPSGKMIVADPWNGHGVVTGPVYLDSGTLYVDQGKRSDNPAYHYGTVTTKTGWIGAGPKGGATTPRC